MGLWVDTGSKVCGWVDSGLFLLFFHKFSNFNPPPQIVSQMRVVSAFRRIHRADESFYDSC